MILQNSIYTKKNFSKEKMHNSSKKNDVVVKENRTNKTKKTIRNVHKKKVK